MCFFFLLLLLCPRLIVYYTSKCVSLVLFSRSLMRERENDTLVCIDVDKKDSLPLPKPGVDVSCGVRVISRRRRSELIDLPSGTLTLSSRWGYRNGFFFFALSYTCRVKKKKNGIQMPNVLPNSLSIASIVQRIVFAFVTHVFLYAKREEVLRLTRAISANCLYVVIVVLVTSSRLPLLFHPSTKKKRNEEKEKERKT